MTRSVSADFILAMEEKLQQGRDKGRTGWDSKWKKISVDSFTLHSLRNKLEEEFWELEDLVFEILDYNDEATEEDIQEATKELRHEAADVANVAMMIADMAGALNDD